MTVKEQIEILEKRNPEEVIAMCFYSKEDIVELLKDYNERHETDYALSETEQNLILNNMEENMEENFDNEDGLNINVLFEYMAIILSTRS
jgi:hypothetical protein